MIYQSREIKMLLRWDNIQGSHQIFLEKNVKFRSLRSLKILGAFTFHYRHLKIFINALLKKKRRLKGRLQTL